VNAIPKEGVTLSAPMFSAPPIKKIFCDPEMLGYFGGCPARFL
jgi:hypothetical protein